jgi:ubiquinone biosynthesis protein Coq4
VKDCHEIWYALLGANVPTMGEVSLQEQVYQKDLIHIVAEKMGISFKSRVP